MSESTDMVNWEERMAAEAKEQAATERAGANRISTRSGVLTYMDQQMPDNMMDVVVLEVVAEQVYYEHAYDPDNPAPPTCFALGAPGSDSELFPHEVVPSPCSDKCGSCPNFQWGSGRGRGKACSTRRRLAVMPASALSSEEEIVKADIAILGVSVTNVKRWGNYVNEVAATHRRPTWGVVTNVALKPDPKTQFSMNFSTSGVITPDMLGALAGQRDKALALISQPYEMTVSDAEEPKSKGKSKASA